MCGICGIYNLDGRPVNQALLERMNDTMIHRGPDGSGIYIDQGIGLGHRRLAIIDLHTGDQPMSSEDGVLHVVFNGEIYNYRTLRTRLEAKCYKFRSFSDTEVLLKAYVHWGIKALNRLIGMFAFAIFDMELNQILLSRDFFGIKPLYYTRWDEGLAFSSEIKSLLTLPFLKREINPQ